MAYSLAEVGFLAEHSGEIDDAAEGLGLTPATGIADAQAMRRRFGEYGRAAMELAETRARHRERLPDGWLADAESAQQATHPAVARLRAGRLARALGQGAAVHDLTCSIGAEGPTATEAGLFYLGSDIDPARLAMAAHNIGPGRVVRADALETTSTADALVADPARRAGGRRIARPEDLSPPLPKLLAAHAGRELAVKCAPGIDYVDWVAGGNLASVVSLAGQVREATLYTAGLSFGERREAVVLDKEGRVARRLTDLDPDAPGEELAREAGSVIVEPDGAVIRAGLVRQAAVADGLGMLDPRVAFLTGEEIPPGQSGFRVLDAVPMRGLKAAVASADASSLEILVRGVDVDPDKLRKKLKLKGHTPRALVIARVGDSAVCFVCDARERAPGPAE